MLHNDPAAGSQLRLDISAFVVKLEHWKLETPQLSWFAIDLAVFLAGTLIYGV